MSRCYCCRAGTPGVIPDTEWGGIGRAYWRLAAETCAYCTAPTFARGCLLMVALTVLTVIFFAVSLVAGR